MRTALIVGAGVVALGLGLGGWLFIAPVAPTPPAVGGAHSSSTGPLPGATPTTGSEVMPPGDGTVTPDRLPPRAATHPPSSLPPADSASARGAIVAGYPVEVAGPLDGSDVIESSVASEGSLVQSALVARTDASPEEVLEAYRARWSALRLAAVPGAEAGAASFGDASSSITVSADASGTGTVYTVFGIVRTG
ncbi:MAG: hypothetical protein NT132_08510 [Microbacterium sp.]|uniref:hypothetical protein n=1 Tax=Microbacterium sp. TaxID=51671 RepID=UPI00261D24D1|nr:hypothetical protein [Microbacterium sp.]MCX6502429.1 hypothetical protein [Microbacterium sp.]